jgi:hypothetical protein
MLLNGKVSEIKWRDPGLPGLSKLKKQGSFFLLIIWHLKIFNIRVFVILGKSVGTILASKIVFKKYIITNLVSVFMP